MTDFLLHNPRAILTGALGADARAEGSLRVRGGRVAEIGALTPEPGERVIDVSGCVIMPGLVNTHHHLFQSVMKAVPAGMSEGLDRWLRLVPYTLWDGIDEEALRVAATIGLAELALSGATTVADHHYFYSEDYDFDPAAVLFDTAAQFGMRFALARGGATKGRSFDDDRITPLPTEPLETFLSRVEGTAARWHDPAPDAMSRVICAPTTPTFSLEEGELREVAQVARGQGLRLHSHLSENLGYVRYTTERYGKRPVEWLAEYGWLGEDVFFAHLVEANGEEVALLAETGTGMAHCPQANTRLGSGIAPATALHQAGGRVSLAVDGAAANEAADMVSALYSAFSVGRATAGAPSLPAETVLHWASAGGARMLGLEGTGILAPGMAADIAVFDLSHPRYMGQHDAALGPIISGGDGCLRQSYVAGQPLVEDGGLPWLDMEQLAADAARVTTRLARRKEMSPAA